MFFHIFFVRRGGAFLLPLCFISVSVLFAQDVPPPVFDKTLYEGVFAPNLRDSSSFDTRLHAHFSELAPDLGAEVYQSFTLETPKNKTLLQNMTEEQKDQVVLNVLFNLRNLEGTEYYSERRKRYRAYILKSYRVNSVKNEDPLPDVLASELVPELVKENDDEVLVYKMHWFRKDSSFGSGVSSYSVFYNPRKHHFYIQMQNLQTVRYKNIVPIAKPHSVSFGVIIKRDGNTYTGYAVTGIKPSDIPRIKSLRRRVGISLMYRLHATIVWFQKTLEQHYADML